MIRQSFQMAISSIGQNKTRAFLTMLGIIIGVIAVVVLVSITNSASASVMEEMQSMGANKISISITGTREQPLTLSEVEALSQTYDSIASVVPSTQQNATVKAGDVSESATVVGTTGSYLDLDELELQSGRNIKMTDVDNNVAVAILGNEIATDLFGDSTGLVGKTLSLDGRSFQIIGVLTDAGSSIQGSDNSNIIIPYTVAQRMFYVSGVQSFTVVADGSENVDAAEQDVTNVLMDKYKDEDSFLVMNQSSMLESMDSVSNTLAYMLGGIAAISLLVGGIGIMNIMLVSVSERTREIGIRKAIGAKKRHILSQFLTESLVLSACGGLIGVGLSWVLLTIISWFTDSAYEISAGIALISVGFSLAIGVAFGINPANKAAKMQPIQALRAE